MEESVHMTLSLDNDYSHDRYKSRRTEAMPKHTLFGADLEILDKQQIEDLKKIDGRKFEQEEAEAKKRPQKILPAAFKAHLPDRNYITSNEEELQKKFKSAHEAKRNLEHLEEQSRYFNHDVRQNALPAKPDASHGQNQWIGGRDLEHTEEINKVGLNDRSYNYAKYGKRAPEHQYSVIGSILQHGMDFKETEKEQLKCPYKKPEIRKNPDWLRHENYLKETATKNQHDTSEESFSGLQLPRNIQHKFGTKLCESLLSDKVKVDRTLKDQEKFKEGMRRKGKGSIVKEISSDPALKTTYDDLGGVLRHNIFPGYNFDHKVGVIKGDFNDSVHKNRVPNLDEYRYKRDELSTWAEHNVLRDRVKKAWDVYLAETMGKAN